MPLLLLRDLPRYECLLEGARRFPELDPSACEVYLHLLRSGDEAFRSCGEPLEAHGISAGRFTVLMLLLRKRDDVCGGVLTPAELADKAGVTRATMTGLIDTLERDGFVRREPNPNDRRMTPVTLTPAGEALLQSVVPAYFQRMGSLVAHLSESERRMLVTLLSKLVRGNQTEDPSVTSADGAAPAPVCASGSLNSSVP
jgi:DNA-binding MarR family transcriptional regulator